MVINIFGIGRSGPEWVEKGYTTYLIRIPKQYKIKLTLISPEIREADQKILQSIPDRETVIALQSNGKLISTVDLSNSLAQWLAQGTSVNFLIGGAEGLTPSLTRRADVTWSLGRLTFPHALVRVILVEQLYRAYTILSNHPYHK